MIVTIELTRFGGPKGSVYRLQKDSDGDYLPYEFKSEEEAMDWLNSNGARPSRKKPTSGIDALYGKTKWVIKMKETSK